MLVALGFSLGLDGGGEKSKAKEEEEERFGWRWSKKKEEEGVDGLVEGIITKRDGRVRVSRGRPPRRFLFRAGAICRAQKFFSVAKLN